MESRTHEGSQHFTPSAGNSFFSNEVDTAAKRAADAARRAGDQISQVATEKYGQAKLKVGNMVGQVNRSVNEQYNKAVDYSRENPGKTTLIAFSAGVGVGALLIGNFRSTRRGRKRVIEPVITALSTLAYDLFA